MPKLTSTFLPGSLSGVTVDIDGCDKDAGAAVALALAELGADVGLRGADRASLQALRALIARHWGRASVVDGAPNGDGHIVRFLSTRDSLRDHLATDTRRSLGIEILLADGLARTDEISMFLADAESRGRRVHAVLLPPSRGDDPAATDTPPETAMPDPGRWTSLVAFLLSPAGACLPNQCLRSAAAGAPRHAAEPEALFPAMPVCGPAFFPPRAPQRRRITDRETSSD
ncbi:MAG TPA: hypothetical protein VEZ59_11220 [Sphingopyxis sp.]|nr:hypothetical protein [Sphingopyxis sp.]